jgi:hypothetical protein
MDKSSWLTDNNIDKVLKYFKIEYPDFKLVTLQEKESVFFYFNVLNGILKMLLTK